MTEVLLVVEFHVDRQVPQSKAWKRLAGCELERVVELPEVILAADNLITLPLDGERRDLQLDHLAWDATLGELRVHAIPEPSLAGVLRAQGVSAWRPWIGKRAADDFLRRCRETGWRVRGQLPRAPAAAGPEPSVTERREPTL